MHVKSSLPAPFLSLLASWRIPVSNVNALSCPPSYPTSPRASHRLSFLCFPQEVTPCLLSKADPYVSILGPSFLLPWDLAWLTLWRDRQAHSPGGFSLACAHPPPSPSSLPAKLLKRICRIFCTCSVILAYFLFRAFWLQPPHHVGGKCLRPPGCTSPAASGSALWAGLCCGACPRPCEAVLPASLCSLCASVLLAWTRRPLPAVCSSLSYPVAALPA